MTFVVLGQLKTANSFETLQDVEADDNAWLMRAKSHYPVELEA